jgi:hypothetical protein
MPARRPTVVALALLLAGLAAWRGACVLTGPDIDTDAYAHHMIARAILADPSDLAVHWVWLPLFHYLQVPFVALGGTMNGIRWVNVALSAFVPVVLFSYVRHTATAGAANIPPDVTALVAALFAGACPIVMQMGTTAQYEPLFALVTLGIAIAYERRRYGATAALLGAAVLLRYEAWAVLVTVGVIASWETLQSMRHRSHGTNEAPGQRDDRAPREPLDWRPWIAVTIPTALILAWAALRRPVDGAWFGFLGQTHQFASQVAESSRGTAEWRRWFGLAGDLLYYPLIVPVRVLGPALPLAAFGVLRTWREQGARFVLVFAAVLGMVSLSWIERASLGLDRHFVAIVPLYATCAAQGAVAIADFIGRRTPLFRSANAARTTGRVVAFASSIMALAILGVVLQVWMGFWRDSIDRGWPERAKLGAYLRSLPEGTTIFCDDATLEVLSGLDRHRFDRHWVDDPETWNLVGDVARAKGVAYVATWQRKLSGHERTGEIVFRASDGASPSSGVAVMRVGPGPASAPASRASAL